MVPSDPIRILRRECLHHVVQISGSDEERNHAWRISDHCPLWAAFRLDGTLRLVSGCFELWGLTTMEVWERKTNGIGSGSPSAY